MSIADIVFKNEEERRSTEKIREYLALIDKIMQSGIERGCQTKVHFRVVWEFCVVH